MENINKDAEFLKDAKFRGLCEEALEKLILIHEPENRASEVQFDIESHCIITSLILIQQNNGVWFGDAKDVLRISLDNYDFLSEYIEFLLEEIEFKKIPPCGTNGLIN